MNEQPTHYIYGLIDPESGGIRYVGKTISPKQRLADHKYNRSRISEAKREWLESMDERGVSPDIVILQECCAAESDECEQRWIRFCMFMGLPIVNSFKFIPNGPDMYMHAKQVAHAKKIDDYELFQKSERWGIRRVINQKPIEISRTIEYYKFIGPNVDMRSRHHSAEWWGHVSEVPEDYMNLVDPDEPKKYAVVYREKISFPVSPEQTSPA